jgi:hypothetical protein
LSPCAAHKLEKRPPDFLCVGAQKSGTSWLFVVMRDTQSVFVTPIKESNYLLEAHKRDRDWVGVFRQQQYEKYRACYLRTRLMTSDIASKLELIEMFHREHVDDEWYLSLFGHAQPDQVAGEICPSYLCMPQENIDHVVRLNPSLRVAVLVRDPVERFWSQVRMDIREGRIGESIDELLDDPRQLRTYLNMSNYVDSIERWKAAIKPGNLGLYLYDRVASDPLGLATDILHFIGACTSQIRGWDQRVNVGQSLDMRPDQRARIWELMADQYAYLRGFFPAAVDRWQANNQLMVRRETLQSTGS